MDVEIKQKWVDALRNGNYKQGSNFLRVDDCYCCLGVLCDIMGGNWDYDKGLNECKHKNNDTLNPESTYYYIDYKDITDNVLLPSSLTTQCKLPSKDQQRLATMNDEGFTFKQIADVIEKDY